MISQSNTTTQDQDTVTWKMICCNTYDVINQKQIKFLNTFWCLDRVDKRLPCNAEGLKYSERFRRAMARELGWCCWFNLYISKYVGYEIDLSNWIETSFAYAWTYNSLYQKSYHGFIKPVDKKIAVFITNKALFTVSALSHDSVFIELIDNLGGFPNSERRCINITPDLFTSNKVIP